MVRAVVKLAPGRGSIAVSMKLLVLAGQQTNTASNQWLAFPHRLDFGLDSRFETIPGVLRVRDRTAVVYGAEALCLSRMHALGGSLTFEGTTDLPAGHFVFRRAACRARK